MSYRALYREWRPQDFASLVGQNHISRTLQNAVSKGRIGHAYLFSGPRGTGKTSTAKILAKAVNCLALQDGQPCNRCANCDDINSSRSLDVLEIDAASNRGIEEIRDIKERVNFAPSQGKFKVYIIDEVHMLTTEAFNALLKTLEEPPPHVIFILATTEPQKIPLTILSRCQRYDFHKIAPRDMELRLKEILDASNVTVEEGVLPIIVKKAEGGLRDAISILDQCMSFGGDTISLETAQLVLGMVKSQALFNLTEAFVEKDAVKLLTEVNTLLREGIEPGQIIKDLLEHLRNMVLLQVCGADSQLVAVTGEEKEVLTRQGQSLGLAWLSQAIGVLARLESESRWRANTRILLETALIGLILQGEKRDQAVLAVSEKKNVEPVVAKKSEEPAKVTTPAENKIEKPSSSVQNGVTLAQVREKWPQVMETVKNLKKTVHAFLMVSVPLEVRGQDLTIVFKDGYSFHKEKVEQMENKKIVEGALEKILGQRFNLVCLLEEEPGQGSSDDPVEKARNIFGSDIVIIKN
ncbi:DNA polymerase III subunit gamma/tau [Thermanaerosceptrum fracticalcis]|uniref:DNA polymerase III subunit gamma/tau n=1 Tax=Thermanaerosceptrum fracticalcis TaxID=1712410 RepID=UPI0005534466|nr:DNA polymerase III subunit gamma/tau [Thermanaerosceptrum fracticalcis]